MNPYVSPELIIKKIRNYNSNQLIENLFFLLNQDDISQDFNNDKSKLPIWQSLLLIKWCFLFGDNKKGKKILSKAKFINLHKYVEKLEGKVLNPIIKENKWDAFFQIIGHQQFYLQQEVHWSDFARHLKLFGSSLKSKYDIEKSFKDKKGLTILEFTFLMNLIWLFTQGNRIKKGLHYKGYIGEELFDILDNIFNMKNQFRNFLDTMTLTEQNVKVAINKYNTGIKNVDFQPFEVSFFTQLPLYKKEEKHIIVHRSLFNYSCNYYLYDYSKAYDSKFTEEFGKRFEKYVELGLKECNVNYITENDLMVSYGKQEKVIDYVVCNQILIECKGIEPKALASVKPEKEIIYNSLKDSIIKAYLHQMLNIIRLNKSLTQPVYGIILTYKDFYVSSLYDIAPVFNNKIEEICKINNWTNNPLPPEHVFIINIIHWDMIVELVKKGKVTLASLLSEMAERNKIDKQKWLRNHLKQYGSLQVELSYLRKENDLLTEMLKAPRSNKL
ncbi:hypothetical protein [Chryseobacterium salviniae]|uniref:NERD domain-containing protein n=1 Tax=Chryseobacterium salviniae TaxID=3101750 RepID=A0ABU6HVH8_9FLAO|nr:hypothetical protein [Chryseobacterium sp. T9W2-O]MEC3877085.1 hypothetical protein [Chryseobacterium sp. T9W2-O]